jgi:hypothetical protein
MSTSELLGISLIFSSILITFVALILNTVRSETRDEGWPYVEGRITEVEEKSFLIFKSYKLTYKYRIKDIEYMNDRFSTSKTWLSLGQLMLNPAFKTANVAQFKGKIVKVFFNRENYWDSVITKSHRAFVYDNLKYPALSLIAINMNFLICLLI